MESWPGQGLLKQYRRAGDTAQIQTTWSVAAAAGSRCANARGGLMQLAIQEEVLLKRTDFLASFRNFADRDIALHN